MCAHQSSLGPGESADASRGNLLTARGALFSPQRSLHSFNWRLPFETVGFTQDNDFAAGWKGDREASFRAGLVARRGRQIARNLDRIAESGIAIGAFNPAIGVFNAIYFMGDDIGGFFFLAKGPKLCFLSPHALFPHTFVT